MSTAEHVAFPLDSHSVAASTTERDLLTPFTGQTCRVVSLGVTQRWSGSAWENVSGTGSNTILLQQLFS